MKCLINSGRSIRLLFLIAIGFSLVIAACKKGNTDSDTPPLEYTPIPESTPISTTVTVYPNTVQASNAYVSVGHYDFIEFYKGSFSKKERFDKYNSIAHMGYHESSGDWYGVIRFLPLTEAPRNYIDMGGLRQVELSSVPTGNGSGYFDLPKGGKLLYPNNAFGSEWRDKSAKIYFFAFDPMAPRSSISNPVTAVDLENKRWYLRSFGGIYINLQQPLINNKPLEIEFPIPANYIVDAPDSLEAWQLANSGGLAWVKKTTAKKQGNMYKCTLPSAGRWVFGLRQPGVYKTFEVRTSQGIPVVNTIVNIKSDTIPIASARTDGFGNAICFVPVNEKFKITLQTAWDPAVLPSTITVDAGPFNFADIGPSRLTYSGNPEHLRIIKGNALKCNGSPIQKGTITIENSLREREYAHLPVVNGQYSGALLKDQYTISDVYALKLTDEDANQTGNDTGIIWQKGIVNEINLSTCKGPSQLFMNFLFNGANYQVTGDISNPFSPDMFFYTGGPALLVAGEGTGSKIQLSFNQPAGPPVGTHPTYFSNVRVNGALIGNGGGTVKFTRYDLLQGGLVEGSFKMNYLESGVERELKGDFRVYRAN